MLVLSQNKTNTSKMYAKLVMFQFSLSPLHIIFIFIIAIIIIGLFVNTNPCTYFVATYRLMYA